MINDNPVKEKCLIFDQTPVKEEPQNEILPVKTISPNRSIQEQEQTSIDDNFIINSHSSDNQIINSLPPPPPIIVSESTSSSRSNSRTSSETKTDSIKVKFHFQMFLIK